MLNGFNINITQQSHYTFLVSGEDAEKLHTKLSNSPAARSAYITGALENGAFILEKIASDVTRTTVTTAAAS